ncbi:FAD-binding oxidoreductase [Parvibaculum sp.]|uniref:NAD(P)/FAD-dependent oxidoreductase n=1 Tax=Parvibaculum sp. TaxID=2024848 RepID=UPI001DD4E833|nr:FAD-binding oxidoreductase [Parvibaculum sp.]MBX3488358.1 FAD-binding oxidoreductase [Parvibaculum sp.]MCW5727664.1 FAD-binding oxidoreductase [Parvibaculum sp.]
MTQSGYPPSWYAATAAALPPLPPLAGNETADVCIVGAGYTGLSAALHLAERGYSVIVLEAERIGWGASGRNGGQLGTGQRKDQRSFEKMLGAEWARRLWELGLESNALVKDLIARHGIACDLKPGLLHAAWKRSDAAWLKDDVEYLATNYGYDKSRYVPRDEMREMVASDRYWGGVLDAGGAHLHPLNYALGLATAARAKGVRIYEGTRALDISRSGVRTAQGAVTASHIVLACNAHLGRLEPRIAGAIMPINNFIVATEPLGARARELIRDDVCVQDTKFVIDYYRLSPDGRLLFGGGESYSPNLPKDIAGFVRKPMLRVFPQLEDVRIDYAWGGTLAITMKRIPHFGRLAPNILYAHGYSGQGINIATLGGKLLAEAVAGQAERFDWIANIKTPDFPGGTWLRYPGLVAGMLFYAMKDRLP